MPHDTAAARPLRREPVLDGALSGAGREPRPPGRRHADLRKPGARGGGLVCADRASTPTRKASPRRGHAPDADDVKRFYLLDRDNPNSIARRDRRGADERAHAAAADLDRDVDAAQHVPPRAGGDRRGRAAPATGCRGCAARIKMGVQEHTGITEGTFFRDQGWCFYMLGRLIERADQTTRLLDIRYHLLVPHRRRGAARRGTDHCGPACCAPPPAITRSAASRRPVSSRRTWCASC